MAERVLRGTRLGAVSYEEDRGSDLAPRRLQEYTCLRGHRTVVPFAEEAEVPATWECRTCGGLARRDPEDLSEPRRAKPARTHWDMLMERRTVEELEALLAERLAVLRAASGGPAPRSNSKKSA